MSVVCYGCSSALSISELCYFTPGYRKTRMLQAQGFYVSCTHLSVRDSGVITTWIYREDPEMLPCSECSCTPPLRFPVLCTLRHRVGTPLMFGESMSQPRIHEKKTGNKHKITNSIKIATFPKQLFFCFCFLKGRKKNPQSLHADISQTRALKSALIKAATAHTLHCTF